MTVFEAKRLLEIYKASQKPPVPALDTNKSTSQTVYVSQPNARKVKYNKSLGWIPNPRTEMNRSYNRIYESFYLERVGNFSETTKGFKKAFHAEARREYGQEKRVAQIKNKWTNLSLKRILPGLEFSSGKIMS